MTGDIRLALGFFGKRKTKRLLASCGEGGVLGLIRLWCWAALNDPEHGRLLDLDVSDIEDEAGWTGEPGALVEALASRRVRYLDAPSEPGGPYALHDWAEHQPWVAGSVRRSEVARANARRRWDAKAHEVGQEPIVPSRPAEAARRADSGPASDPVPPGGAPEGGRGCNPHSARIAQSNAPSPSPSPSPKPNPSDRARTRSKAEAKAARRNAEDRANALIDEYARATGHRILERTRRMLALQFEKQPDVVERVEAATRAYLQELVANPPEDKHFITRPHRWFGRDQRWQTHETGAEGVQPLIQPGSVAAERTARAVEADPAWVAQRRSKAEAKRRRMIEEKYPGLTGAELTEAMRRNGDL